MTPLNSIFNLWTWLSGIDIKRTNTQIKIEKFVLLLVTIFSFSMVVVGCNGDGGGDGNSTGGSSNNTTNNTGTAGGNNNNGSGGGSIVAVDRANVSLVDNLLVKENAGEWTRGEGLAATLQLMAGESDASSVLRDADLLNDEGTGIVAMAKEYLENGPDEDAKAEITRLLNLILFSDEQLKAMAGVSTQTAQSVSVDSVTDCQAFFQVNITPGLGECLEILNVLDDIYPGAFRIYKPKPDKSLPDGGWKQHHYDLAEQAVKETVPVYKKLGKLETASIVFSVADLGGDNGLAAALTNQKTLKTANGGACAPNPDGPVEASCIPACGIALFTKMQGKTDADFKQYVAHELAHCFQQHTFPQQNDALPFEVRAWREEGLADYMSNIVYPFNNVEWGTDSARRKSLDELAGEELTTTIFDRSYENFIFFQYLSNRLGVGGLMDFIKGLPAIADQAAALATTPDIDNLYHDFAKALTDKEVIDTSLATIPYKISEKNNKPLQIAGPSFKEGATMAPFGVQRYQIFVDSGKEADLFFTPGTGVVRDSSRPNNEIKWGDLPPNVKGLGCEPSNIVVVTTTHTEGVSSYTIESPAVRDLPGGGPQAGGVCSIVGTWVVDNSSLNLNSSTHTVTSITGEIRVTFKDDGTAEVVYDGFTYSRVHDTTISVGGNVGHRHDENTTFIDAAGTTTYQVDGDEITLGSTFESGYLKGTETLHHIDTFDPPGIVVGPNIDETFDRDPSGIFLFGGFSNFDIQTSGSILVWRFGDKVQARLNRVSDDGGV